MKTKKKSAKSAKPVVTLLTLFVMTVIMVFTGRQNTVEAAASDLQYVSVSGNASYSTAKSALSVVNEELEAEGVSSLTMDQSLYENAAQRAGEISIYYSHTRPDGTDGLSIDSDARLEIIVSTASYSGSDLVEALKESGDWETITNGGYTEIGIGNFQPEYDNDAYNTFTNYWVLLLGKGTAKQPTYSRYYIYHPVVLIDTALFEENALLLDPEYYSNAQICCAAYLQNPMNGLFVMITHPLDSSLSVTNTLKWSSSDTSIATVYEEEDYGGAVITQVGSANEMITLTAALGNLSAKTEIEVAPSCDKAVFTSCTNTSAGVELKWGAVEGAGSYWIYRWESADKGFVFIGSTTSTTFVDTDDMSAGYQQYKLVCMGKYGYVIQSGNTIEDVCYVPASTTQSLANVSDGVKITWTESKGASGYYIYRKTGSGSYTHVITITAGTTLNCTDYDVISGNKYTYYVQPYYKSGTSSNASVNTGAYTTKTIVFLGKGAISSLTNVTSGITIKWSKVSGATGYYIYRKSSSGSYSNIKTITSGSTVSYTDTAVKSKSGTTYSYYVVPYYKSGSTIYKAAYTPKSILRLSSATISSLTNTSSGITVKWSKITGSKGYYIYRKAGSGSYSLAKTITSGSTTSWSDTTVKSKNGTTYTYYVIPYFKSSSGAITKGSYTNTKKMVRLTSVSISSLKNSSSKKMTVKWAKNSKATGYQIQYSTSSSFASGNKTVTVSGASSVSKVISSLTKGKTYYVRVRAYKTVSGTKYYSAWSSKKSVKISK